LISLPDGVAGKVNIREGGGVVVPLLLGFQPETFFKN
jgi:hypothetical protein